MKKSNLVVFIAFTAAAGFFLWTLWQITIRPHIDMGYYSQSGSSTTATQFEAKTASNNGIEIAVQPLYLSSGPWKFTIGLNTHAGSLDMDFLKTVSLTDDRGEMFVPLSWDGPPPGGHHRNGTITFPAPATRPHRVTLTIAGGGGITTSTFSWDLP